MNGEPIPFLKVSANPSKENAAIGESLRAAEGFLSNLSPEQQGAFIGSLVTGKALPPEQARQRLESLREPVAEAASQLFLPRRRR
jgi:hypothetical protein